MADYLLLEDGSRLLLEDGTGDLLLEPSVVSQGVYLVQEEDGASRFTLEDGTGFILLEASSPPPVFQVVTGGTVRQLRRQPFRRTHGDEEVALILLAATRRRFRLK